MSIDLEAIRARAEAASEGPWYEEGWFTEDEDGDYVEIEPADAVFISHAREDIPALLAEVERLTNICKAQKASCSLVKTVEAAGLKDKVEQLTVQIASVTAERDAAANAVARMAEYIVTLGGVDYHLCDDIPQEHHLKFQPKNDGDYDNEPCIECVKAYFMSGAGKEQNDG